MDSMWYWALSWTAPPESARAPHSDEVDEIAVTGDFANIVAVVEMMGPNTWVEVLYGIKNPAIARARAAAMHRANPRVDAVVRSQSATEVRRDVEAGFEGEGALWGVWIRVNVAVP